MKKLVLATTATVLCLAAAPTGAFARAGNSHGHGAGAARHGDSHGHSREGYRGKSQIAPPGWKKSFEHANEHAWKGFQHRPPRPCSY